jgi:hypothetical protein
MAIEMGLSVEPATIIQAGQAARQSGAAVTHACNYNDNQADSRKR